VRFCGVCVTRPNLCIVTQYFANGSLENLLIKREPKPSLDLRTLVSMAKDIASGILHLHMEGVIHRDLAVRNLLVDDNMSVRVADFGMSRIKQASVGHTNSSVGPLKWYFEHPFVSCQMLTITEY
jgi:serine/threonine protein kinase